MSTPTVERPETPLSPALEVGGLTKTFAGRGRKAGSVTAVDNVSFTLERGECLAIIGESGSGKSTIARILVGLETPSSGTIAVAGRSWNIAHKPTQRRAHARAVQMVFQDPYSSLDPHQSIGSMLTEVLTVHFPRHDAPKDRVSTLLEQVGLDPEIATARPRALSGGQRQRAAIARALAGEPDVLILDEAVAALDVSVQAQILNLLTDLRATTPVSYLFISHDLAVVRHIAENCLVLQKGRVVEQGAARQVLDHPQHPYTQQLRASVPGPHWRTGTEPGDRPAITHHEPEPAAHPGNPSATPPLQAAAVGPAEDFDPLSTDEPGEIYPEYDELRARCPVAHTSAHGGYWALTRYDDVAAAASDSRLYISSVRAVVPSDPRGLRRPPLNFDAPRHTPYRRALDRTLQRRRLEHLEPQVRQHARQELGRMLAAGGGDIATELGTKLPAWVTTEWLNLDADVAPVLAETSSAWVDAWRAQDREQVNIMSERMYDIARELVADRNRHPRDPNVDPASSLLAERIDGEPLDQEQIVAALRQSLVVGMVAPPILIGSICEHLSNDPDLQSALRNRPEDVPAAVEEFVRLYTPYRGFARTVTEETEIRGRTIHPEEPVTLVYAAANRDPAVFPNPAEFQLNRPNILQHLGWGRGRHQCAGMPLARMMLIIGLEELLAATDHFVTTHVSGGARMPELGPTSVPITLVPRTVAPQPAL